MLFSWSLWRLQSPDVEGENIAIGPGCGAAEFGRSSKDNNDELSPRGARRRG